MKNIFKCVLASIIVVIASSCSEDDRTKAVIDISKSTSPTLISPSSGGVYVLTKADADKKFETFTWIAAKAEGADVQMIYEIQIDKKGNDFKNPQVVFSVVSPQVSVDVVNNDICKAAFSANPKSDIPLEFEVRVNAKIGELGLYSSPITMTLTLYPSYDDWGVIGNATPGGWDNDTNFEYNADTKEYYITVDLTVGDIKFRKDNAWDVNYGDDGNNLSLEPNGANIPIAVAGNYTINVSFETLKYTIKKN